MINSTTLNEFYTTPTLSNISFDEVFSKFGLVRGSGDWDKPYQWLVNGLIPNRSIGLLSGPSTGGKTFTTIDLLGSVAFGTKFLNTLEVPFENTGAVLYCSVEGETGINHRFEAWRQTRGIEKQEWDKKIIRFNKPFSFKNVNSHYFCDVLKALESVHGEKIKLVVFDTFITYGGVPNENSSSDIQIAMSWMREVSANADVSVMGIHHTGKGEVEIGCDFNYLLRGSSDLGASAEFVIGVVKSNTSSNYEVTVSGVWPSKLKDKKTSEPIAASIESYDLALSCGDIEKVGVISTSNNSKLPAMKNNVKSVAERSSEFIVNILNENKTALKKNELKIKFVELEQSEDSTLSAGTINKRFSRALSALIKRGEVIEQDSLLTLLSD